MLYAGNVVQHGCNPLHGEEEQVGAEVEIHVSRVRRFEGRMHALGCQLLPTWKAFLLVVGCFRMIWRCFVEFILHQNLFECAWASFGFEKKREFHPEKSHQILTRSGAFFRFQW